MTTAFEVVYVRKEEEPVLAPPTRAVGPVAWVRARLFSSPLNAGMTLVSLLLLVWIIPPLVRWAIVDAVWRGDGREACIVPGAGACWAFVRAKFGLFIYGHYPERWRADLTAVLLVIGLVPMAMPRAPFKRENAIYLLLVFPIVALVLLTGGHLAIPFGLVVLLLGLGSALTALIAFATAQQSAPFLAGLVAPGAVLAAIAVFVVKVLFGAELAFAPAAATVVTGLILLCMVVALGAGLVATFASRGRPGARAIGLTWTVIAGIIVVVVVFSIDFGLLWVETPLWGGLLVTLVVAIVGIVASLPIGIVLALGRRSKLPVVRICSIGFIEFVRGVPLITVLFMASVMLPVFLPPGVNFDKLLRALIGVALFSSAYMAEVVRGGLQAIPRGQYEAAHAVGLKYWQTMQLIILPQALKIVIPGIVNSFISLFKDTSLVLIIGIFDLLGIVQQGFTDANWASPETPMTGYVFAAAVFWVFCFSMSRYSIYTERRLHTGHKR